MKKKRHLSMKAVLLTWILIYILAMVIGTSLSCFYTYESNENLPDLLHMDTEYYLDTGEFTPKTYYYRNSAFVYSPDMQLIESHTESDSELDFTPHAARLIPEVLEKGSAYKMLIDTELDTWVGLVVAEEMEDGNVYFMVRGIRSLQTLILVLFFSLTVFLILSCLYSALIIRNSRRIEALRREYVANVSHDLKSPIASIKALSESLYDGVISDSERQKKCIGLIRRETDRLESTVMNMLELSRTQSMQTGYEKSAIRPAELFLPVVEKFSERCSGLEIQFTPPADTERLPTLFTNADRVRVLTNVLLDNAIKFVSPGGHIRLEAEMGHKCIIVCVRDDGVGIPKDEQKRIFERFYTGNLARNSKGSGLGLAIADETARILGEKLWVESAPGKGAAFYFTIGTKTD